MHLYCLIVSHTLIGTLSIHVGQAMTNSCRKGKTGEREAAHEVARIFGVEARRGVQFQGGTDSPDIKHGIDGVHFEVKRTESLRLWKALEQAIADCGQSVPVVLHRANGKPWVAIVRLDDLPKLATQVYLTMMGKA